MDVHEIIVIVFKFIGDNAVATNNGILSDLAISSKKIRKSFRMVIILINLIFFIGSIFVINFGYEMVIKLSALKFILCEIVKVVIYSVGFNYPKKRRNFETAAFARKVQLVLHIILCETFFNVSKIRTPIRLKNNYLLHIDRFCSQLKFAIIAPKILFKSSKFAIKFFQLFV